MMFVTLTFWLLVVVFAAWGVQRLWGGIVKPKMMNIVLLPGTLVAQLGHVLGLLVTGATVTNTALITDESAEPGTTRDPKPRIPVVGPMIIGLLPLLACGGALFFTAEFFGGRILSVYAQQKLPLALPTSLSGLWQLLRDQITMVERLVEIAIEAMPGSWQLWLFIYLMICLTVRMAPFPGNVRGSLGAIVLLGLIGALLGLIWESPGAIVESGWVILSLIVPTLLLLLLLSAVIRGAIGLGRIVATNG